MHPAHSAATFACVARREAPPRRLVARQRRGEVPQRARQVRLLVGGEVVRARVPGGTTKTLRFLTRTRAAQTSRRCGAKAAGASRSLDDDLAAAEARREDHFVRRARVVERPYVPAMPPDDKQHGRARRCVRGARVSSRPRARGVAVRSAPARDLICRGGGFERLDGHAPARSSGNAAQSLQSDSGCVDLAQNKTAHLSSASIFSNSR